ncbi:MAG: ABC transporter substrate-binding protein [Devosia sp.]|nr:ABC transporter substrate-binding protein [Devosia sp.]
MAIAVPTVLAQDGMTTIAIANNGPHVTLDEAVVGFKRALADNGYVEGKNVTYAYQHGNFDPSLTPQVLRSLEAQDPDLLVTITTPVSQAAVNLINNKELPIVFVVVADPLGAQLVPDWEHGSERFVGSSNLQSLEAIIAFADELLGGVESMGLLYNPGDVGDVASLKAAEAAANAAGIRFKAEGVESVNDIQQRTTALNGVDFIYVPSSNLIQPALPAVAASADRMGIPVINASHPAVQEGAALASLSVSYDQVGYNGGLLAVDLLKGAKPAELANFKPSAEQHVPLINAKRLSALGLTLPASLADCDCLVD